MPVPAVTDNDVKRVAKTVKRYLAAVSPPDEILSSFHVNVQKAEKLLKQLDAEILRLYNLPPYLEARLLRLFDELPKRDRSGVPFPFGQYFSMQNDFCVPLIVALADSAGRKLPELPLPPSDKLYSLVTNCETDERERALALNELALMEDRELPEFLDQEMQRPDNSPYWRNHLILAAEKVRFSDESRRRRIQDRLYECAKVLRDDDSPDSLPVLQSALRRYCSMVPRAEVDRLRHFLRRKDQTRCWQVVLQGIQNIFSQIPPTDESDIEKLRERVASILKNRVSPKSCQPGTEGALTVNACHALAVLKHPELQELIESLEQMAEPWFIDTLHERLKGMAE